MSLPTPNLDDRRFQDIVDEARRLIVSYCPEWTNFEPSDPGVALVELFAWMSEMLMFRLNQVPDIFYTRMLDLIGLQPFPPQAARTDVTFLLAPGFAGDVLVPRGTQVSTTGADPMVFATTEDLLIEQTTLTHALTERAPETLVDVWNQLHDPAVGVSCLLDPPNPGSAFYLGFAGTLAANMIRLDLEAWVEGIGVDPAAPPLSWEVWSGDSWWPTTVHVDETGGLCRPGAITLLVGSRHEQLTLMDFRAYWLRARVVAPSQSQPAYLSSPRITSLATSTVGGTVVAEHSQTMPSEVLGVSDGRPDQRYTARVSPVLPRIGGETVRVFSSYSTLDWQEVPTFVNSDANDLHFTWDSASGEVRFGPCIRYADGSMRQHGAIPPPGAEITLTEYRHGGGAMGNVGAQTLSVLRTSIEGVDRVVNLRRAVGGVDAESVENAKERGPLLLHSGHQAVTGDDYERLVLESHSSVARVRCVAPSETGAPVRLLIVPYPEPSVANELDSYALPDRMIESLIGVLDRRRMIGVAVEIGTPYYQGVSVVALVRVRPGRPVALVQDRAIDAINGYLDPVTGGREGAGWPFDEDLRDHGIFRLLESIDGVERVDDVALFEFDLRMSERVGFAKNTIQLDRDSLFLSARPQIVVQ